MHNYKAEESKLATELQKDLRYNNVQTELAVWFSCKYHILQEVIGPRLSALVTPQIKNTAQFWTICFKIYASDLKSPEKSNQKNQKQQQKNPPPGWNIPSRKKSWKSWKIWVCLV